MGVTGTNLRWAVKWDDNLDKWAVIAEGAEAEVVSVWD